MSDVETRGRKQVVTKGEVLDILEDKRWHTAAEIANTLDVCRATISSRVKEIATDGHIVLMGRDGYLLTSQEDITDEDAARAIERMSTWMIAVVTRQAMSAKPMKRLLMEARKLLPKTTTERNIVRKYLVQLTHLIDFTEVDEA
jgi:biotin operon repressor